MDLTEPLFEFVYTSSMTTSYLIYSYTWLPVLLRQLRQGKETPANIRDFLAHARTEVMTRQEETRARQSRFLQYRRSRTESRQTLPCFECEQRVLLHAAEALNGLECYLQTANADYLREAQADYSASEHQYETLIRLRKRLPSSLQEDLQRAA